MAEKNEGEPFYRIDVQEAKQMIDAGGVQVIDTREPYEHAEGHVPGSLRIQHMAILLQADKLATDRPILFICKSGQRSAVAAEIEDAALGTVLVMTISGRGTGSNVGAATSATTKVVASGSGTACDALNTATLAVAPAMRRPAAAAATTIDPLRFMFLPPGIR